MVGALFLTLGRRGGTDLGGNSKCALAVPSYLLGFPVEMCTDRSVSLNLEFGG